MARRVMVEAEGDPANWYIAPESGAYAEIRLDRWLEDVSEARGLPAVEAKARLRARWTGFSATVWDELLAIKPERFESLRRDLQRFLVPIQEKERISTLNLSVVRARLPEILATMGGDPGDRLLLEVLGGLLAPNLVLDRERVARLAEQAKEKIPPVVYRSGEPVLEKGEIVTEEKYQLLQHLRLVEGKTGLPVAFLGLVLFVLALGALAVGYLHRFHREMLRQERFLYPIALTTILAAVVGKFFALNPSSNLAYFAPVAFGPILWTLFLEARLAFMLTVLLALLMGVINGFQLNLVLYTLFGGSVAVFVLHQRQQRADLMRSGLFIALANIFSVALLGFFAGAFPPWPRFLLAGFNGFTAAVMAIGLLPFLENLFGLTSAIRLLELANPNQPLLRQMLIEAPGTYHHSIMVGNLAEAAAERIGADGLLVRVGAYYHDIGKLKRPYFFAENQLTQENPHEKLTPTLSTLIITAHVKEGVEMARLRGLPEAIVDIIEQHHGTDLVRYFYARAAESAQTELAETDFRYDGPRPRTKEAALVMLADSVEAAVRAMTKPGPAKVEALVTRIFKERLDDGQFDECDLTLRDLEQIKAAFLKVLGGIFHTRIEYPESVLREIERKKGANGDLRKQPAG
ncbi:MAG: HDIG domain-containing protein [Firmicutes bacterium]|nr:HDIG domain-containing protein [Bacillota bacterium]